MFPNYARADLLARGLISRSVLKGRFGKQVSRQAGRTLARCCDTWWFHDAAELLERGFVFVFNSAEKRNS